MLFKYKYIIKYQRASKAYHSILVESKSGLEPNSMHCTTIFIDALYKGTCIVKCSKYNEGFGIYSNIYFENDSIVQVAMMMLIVMVAMVTTMMMMMIMMMISMMMVAMRTTTMVIVKLLPFLIVPLETCHVQV